jgi:glycolate oxidase iron-sulfur subunit
MAAQTQELTGTPETAHLDCIHCGLCLSACPTYLQLGMEADSPRGRIYLIQAMKEGRVSAVSLNFQQHMLLCLECRACETACPSGVRFSSMMDEARIEMRSHRQLSIFGRLAHWIVYRKVFPSRKIMHLGFRALRLYQRGGLQRLVRASGILRLLPSRIARMEALLPVIPPSPKLGLPEAPSPGSRRKALLFRGCIMPELFGPVHQATVRVLQRNGISIGMPMAQVCCGALHLHDGDRDAALQLARQNIAAFEKDREAVIVVNAAGCGAMLKEYGELLADDPIFAQRALDFSRRVRDVCEYLDSIPIHRMMERVNLKVAYDDPCHLLHAQGIKSAPRNLLRTIPGLQLVELRDADHCCGSAGIYNILQPEMSARILDEKIANIIRSGAEVIASGNPGCILQIQAGLDARNLPIQAVHPIELLDRAYRLKFTEYLKSAKS